MRHYFIIQFIRAGTLQYRERVIRRTGMKKAVFILAIFISMVCIAQSQAHAGQFGELLIELETSVFYSAQSAEWRSRRDAWIADIRAAGDNVAALKRLLVEFETHLNYSAQAPAWRNRRAQWLQNVNNANTIRELAQQLIVCETAISYSAQAAAWRSRRPGWLSRVRAL